MRILPALIILTLISSAAIAAPNPDVQHVGELKNVLMKGEAGPRIWLGAVPKKNLFALGPLEYLKGEITVIDGKPYVSKSTRRGITVKKTRAARAALLVYANVPSWTAVTLPPSINTLKELEAYIPAAAAKAGLDVEQAFPFQVTGTFAEADYHIVRGTTKGLHPTSHEKSDFSVKNEAGTIVGFFSKIHRGVFTHADSTIHAHYVSANEKDAGHLDGFKGDSKNPLSLLLPSATP